MYLRYSMAISWGPNQSPMEQIRSPNGNLHKVEMTRDQNSSFINDSSYEFNPPSRVFHMQRSNMVSDSFFSNFMQESHDRFNQLLEEKGFAPIPPPAGFGTPTRPASLLKEIFPSEPEPQSVNSNPVPVDHPDTNSRQFRPNWNSDLPSSPLSPPSPFQHPFFQMQMGLTADPWARFSGFGIPRLTPLINHKHRELIDKRFSQTFDLHNRKSDSNILEGRNVKVRHIRTASADEIDSSNGGDVRNLRKANCEKITTVSADHLRNSSNGFDFPKSGGKFGANVASVEKFGANVASVEKNQYRLSSGSFSTDVQSIK